MNNCSPQLCHFMTLPLPPPPLMTGGTRQMPRPYCAVVPNLSPPRASPIWITQSQPPPHLVGSAAVVCCSSPTLSPVAARARQPSLPPQLLHCEALDPVRRPHLCKPRSAIVVEAVKRRPRLATTSARCPTSSDLSCKLGASVLPLPTTVNFVVCIGQLTTVVVAHSLPPLA
jgi:hypothetical protein